MLLTFLCFILVCTSAPMAQQGSVFIAPPVLTRVDEARWEQLVAALSRVFEKEGMSVMSPREGQESLSRAGISTMEPCENADCARLWGEKLRVQRVVLTALRQDDELLRTSFLSVNISDAGEEPVTLTHEITGEFEQILAEVIPAMALRLAGISQSAKPLHVVETVTDRRAQRRNLLLGAGIGAAVVTAGVLVAVQETGKARPPSSRDLTFEW